MLAKKTIDEVKSYYDIVAIISDYVTLKRKGRNYLGFCPFHSEKTPSFTVSPDKQIWHCFGCHASGDHISFVMQIDNLSFPEAVIQIAQKVGIEVIQDNKVYQPSPEEKEDTRKKEILFSAREYFTEELNKNNLAKNYLLKRGLNEPAIKSFYLGYSPDSNELYNLLLKKTFNSKIIESAGFAYNRFRGRLIFPIIDHQGRTIGFGGRILENLPEVAKYLNSEESNLFNKRKILYGFNLAKKAINTEKSIIIMEGYMDVITAHQYGFQNTVGVMGTALTENHIQTIKRYCDTMYLAFDSDAAGQQALLRSLELANKFSLKCFVVKYPAKDPADFLHEKGAAAFKELLKNALSQTEFRFIEAKKTHGTSNIESMAKIINEIIPYLQNEHDEIVKNYYINKISNDLHISQELILAKMQKIRYIFPKRKIIFKASQDKYLKAEDSLLYLLSTNIDIKEQILKEISSKDLIRDNAKKVFSKLVESPKTDKELLEIIEEPELKAFLSRLLINCEDINSNQYKDYIEALKEYKKNERIQEIKNQLKILEKTESIEKDEEVNKLLTELNILIKPI